MFGFPPILDGRAGVKMTRDADSGFPKPGIREIFYSVRDGNWTDPNVWQTASGRVGLLPGANDDVYVRNGIILPTTPTTYNVNNLFIVPNGVLQFSTTIPLTVNVFGNLQSLGNIIMFNSVAIFNLHGLNNRIDTYFSNGGTINYVASQTQPILNTPTLAISLQNGIKTISQDLVCSRFTILSNASLELGGYNMTVNGIATIAGRLTKSTYGNILITGTLGIAGTLMDLSEGNPDVELRGGISVGGSMANFKSGTGVWTLSTNSQGIGQSGITSTTIFDCQILIKSGITFTISMANTQTITLNNIINGEDGTSRLVNNNSTLNFGTAASVPSMTTGTWDFTTNANTIQYNGNYSATIPSYFTNFHSLTIGGTGTKTTGANVTANGNVSIGSNANLTLGGNLSITGNLTLTGIVGTQNSCFLECGNFNLSVTGTTSGTGGCSLTKTGAGSLLFIGAFSFVNLFSRLLFTGNPTVEFRNGFAFAGGNGLASDCGTGLWSFTTVSQTLNLSSAGTFTLNNVQIVGNITVTYSNPTGQCLLTIGNSINGTTAGSTFVHTVGTAGATGNGLRITSASTVIMSTGVFDLTTNNNLIVYDSTTPITLAYSTYRNLRVEGSGVKTLGSNTTVQGQLEVGRFIVAGTLQCSTFNLTVNDATTMGTGASFLKSGAGSLTFIGALNLTFFGFVFDLSGGNPTVELRGGLTYNTNANTFNSGTGQWTFSTASQAIASTAANLSMTFNCPILISGANTLSINNNSGTFTVTMLGLLNGDNAASTLRMGTNTPTLNYQNTTQPMATGVLDTNTNLNTFIYGGAVNQDVKGGTPQNYRNLRFSGSGTTKRLLGNINVANTYTVDSGVLVDLNGFTKSP